jgi:hypothetical protein
VGHELEDLLPLARLVDERLGGAEGGAGGPEEAEDELLRLLGVRLAVGLLLGPAGAGDEEELRVGLDGLLAAGRGAGAVVREAGAATSTFSMAPLPPVVASAG